MWVLAGGGGACAGGGDDKIRSPSHVETPGFSRIEWMSSFAVVGGAMAAADHPVVRWLAGPVEHPVVRRLRHRRLLGFLRHQGLDGTFETMVQETEAFFSVAQLQDLMRQGQWHDALTLLSRFLQVDDDRLLSLEAQVLCRFLSAHRNLADILAGSVDGRVLGASLCNYLTHDRNFCHGDLRLKSIMLTVLHAKQLLRVSWERVRQRAAEIAYDLVHRTPELKGVVLLPPSPMKSQDVLPILPCSGRRCCGKKHSSQSRASALAKSYLQTRGSLLSSSDSKESAKEIYVKVVNWVADILDESLKAGKHLELHQKHPLQTNGKQGAIVAPSSSTTFGFLAGAVKNPGSMSVENGGINAGKAAHHVPTPSAPIMTTMLGHCEKSGTALTADAGTTKHSSQVGCNAESVCQNLNPRKNPRDVTASDEHNRHPKKQRTSGAFAEASMRPMIRT